MSFAERKFNMRLQLTAYSLWNVPSLNLIELVILPQDLNKVHVIPFNRSKALYPHQKYFCTFQEYSLEKAYSKMKDEWIGVDFSLNSYKDYTIKVLGSVDDIQTLLDDHIIKTQTMTNSPFVKPFETEIKVCFNECDFPCLHHVNLAWLRAYTQGKILPCCSCHVSCTFFFLHLALCIANSNSFYHCLSFLYRSTLNGGHFKVKQHKLAVSDGHSFPFEPFRNQNYNYQLFVD